MSKRIHPEDPRVTAYALGELSRTERGEVERAALLNPAVQEALAFAVSRRAVQVRLNPRPPPRRSDPTDGPCRELPPGTPLRFALQAAIFHRESLRGLLQAGESIWESEGNGNQPFVPPGTSKSTTTTVAEGEG